MEAHQQRVVEELDDLKGKIARLQAFLETDICEALPSEQQGLLALQAQIMGAYAMVLAQRIEAFS